MVDSVEISDRSGRRFLLVASTAIAPCDDAAVRELCSALLGEPGGEAMLRATAIACGVATGGTLDAIIDALVGVLAGGDFVIADPERWRGRGLAPIGLDGRLVEDWDEYLPIAELLPPAPAEEPESQPTLMRLELGALGFAERCVLLLPRPGAGLWHPWAALTTVANHLKQNPGDTLVAVGHRESAEPGDHGRLRAAALVHFIMGERDAWLAIAAKWGRVRDTQEYLAYLRHARGWPLPTVPITDEADDATAAAVLAFQQAYNARPECAAAIFEDGVIGAQTLGAIFDTARTELRQWLGLRRTDCDAFVWHDASQPALDCATAFKPYRTMPALPVQHRGRMVDLVIVPAQEAGEIDLGRGPTGVYDVAAIQTLALGGVVAPRTGMSIEIVLRDASDAAVADAAYEVDVPGGARMCGRLDAHGEARIGDLVEGWCRVRFPELPGGCELHEIAALE